MIKPFSQACENNKQSILNILTRTLIKQKQVLEIGSGTGQHAVYFAKNLPFLTWQTGDLSINHEGINQWITDLPSPNIRRPLAIDLADFQPLATNIDAIFSANTLHIMSWPLVQKLFKLVEKTLNKNGMLCLYGPFNYQGKYSSESNANFDLWLKERDEQSGIRDFETICQLAIKAGLSLKEDVEMPANNRMLIFQKTD
ncbi:MAG: cyclopropane fatty-acyl-phospholipid synthase-like methyltransferase [Colwellia sp.]|jgi:cyclopropane fatty-acyl-phospholipid synthase-like methyltransferase